jgi:hypothetical protein
MGVVQLLDICEMDWFLGDGTLRLLCELRLFELRLLCDAWCGGGLDIIA